MTAKLQQQPRDVTLSPRTFLIQPSFLRFPLGFLRVTFEYKLFLNHEAALVQELSVESVVFCIFLTVAQKTKVVKQFLVGFPDEEL